mmetsp:Transcript_8968/g.13943  ORF Transcript_8968/g.13943 Transcript_8968/m.13943 type:complete len:570 (-) Transcript_8968:1205-2914(-)|eukprot:CAMPEP_0194215470 /NCGR_PEP_ID=MMETSP0156-20130528/17300_1 /TAXON_ID=33649 /ORGANISM="Thalassionema nitzschioides, Strain L26-B" /LENGTH=569 /DNA_ID=CAMNT_0038943989 /DNA_START=15 /DNA_END=1724 /DNA_ORIENTATION=-
MAYKKASLLIPLLFALWLLKDDEENSTFAVTVALRRHPPSMRVFRALFEISLVLFATAISLHVWCYAVGSKVVGMLIFKKVDDNTILQHRGLYRVLSTEDGREQFNDEEIDDGDEKKDSETSPERHGVSEEDTWDADYASDGEVLPGEETATSECFDPPRPAVVASAAIDLLIVTLLSLFLFTLSSAEGGRYIEGVKELSFMQITARIAAPLFPLFLFGLVTFTMFFPWQKRKPFWTIVSYTIGAPLFDVTFRDGFIGDVLTSTVRPLQDIAFTAFYIVSGLRGWWTQTYDLDGAAMPVEKSWIVRTIILPACMISPLWYRFNQNLRQTYDSKKRWPYLGNALKYLAAAEVAMFGTFDPSRKTSPTWLFFAVLATLYQIWWDIIMDWELIRYSKGKIRLRAKRLYNRKSMYWTILVVNIVLRFGWTMTFMPNHFLDKTGVLKATFQGILKYVDPVLASAEIIRRMLWGFIRLELEAIKCHSDNKYVTSQLQQCSDLKDDEPAMLELSAIELHDAASTAADVPPCSLEEQDLKPVSQEGENDITILIELALWTSAFAGGGIIAAVHRGVF